MTNLTKPLTAVLYSNQSQECDRARMLLKSLGGEYLEYTLGVDFTETQFRLEFGESAEYPQVSIGAEYIGSLKETLHYFQDTGLL